MYVVLGLGAVVPLALFGWVLIWDHAAASSNAPLEPYEKETTK